MKDYSLIWWLLALTYGISVFWTILAALALGASLIVGFPTVAVAYRLILIVILIASMLADAHKSRTDSEQLHPGTPPDHELFK